MAVGDYMISLRKTSGAGGVGPPRYLTMDGPDAAAVSVSAQTFRARILAEFPKPPPAPDGRTAMPRTGEVMLFVHGFNVSAESARRGHFKMRDALRAAGWPGVLVSYDWPSDGLVFAYLPDRETARLSASALVTSAITLLRDAQAKDCRVNVHLMSHSMGAFVVQQAFTWAYQDVPPDWGVAQLIFVAADVDATVFSADNPSAKALARHSGRLTAYTDRYDKALAISNAKRLELAPRMGRVGLPDDAPSSSCEVDCSDLFKAVFKDFTQELDPGLTHGFYFDRPEFWQDVVLTLAGGIDRSRFPTRTHKPDAPMNRYLEQTKPLAAAAYKAALNQATMTPLG